MSGFRISIEKRDVHSIGLLDRAADRLLRFRTMKITNARRPSPANTATTAPIIAPVWLACDEVPLLFPGLVVGLGDAEAVEEVDVEVLGGLGRFGIELNVAKLGVNWNAINENFCVPVTS